MSTISPYMCASDFAQYGRRGTGALEASPIMARRRDPSRFQAINEVPLPMRWWSYIATGLFQICEEMAPL